MVANGDGILVAAPGRANVVQRNRSHSNGDDGIDVNCRNALCGPDQTTVTRDAANGNGDLGTEADPGTDEGGNKARRNGNPGQCENVACS